MIGSWWPSVNDPRYNLIANAYRNFGRWSGAYAKIRMALCPLLDIERSLPATGKLIDVGCGAGLLLQWLALGQKDEERTLIGMEIDSRRVALGKQVCGRLAVNGRIDLRLQPFGQENSERDLTAVVFVDVLHHMDYDLQIKMLSHAFELLDHGGMVLIKDVGSTPVVKFWYCYVFDAMTRAAHITQGKVGYYRSQSGWMSLLSECGFRPFVTQVRHIDFAPHILITGKKP